MFKCTSAFSTAHSSGLPESRFRALILTSSTFKGKRAGSKTRLHSCDSNAPPNLGFYIRVCTVHRASRPRHLQFAPPKRPTSQSVGHVPSTSLPAPRRLPELANCTSCHGTQCRATDWPRSSRSTTAMCCCAREALTRRVPARSQATFSVSSRRRHRGGAFAPHAFMRPGLHHRLAQSTL